MRRFIQIFLCSLLFAMAAAAQDTPCNPETENQCGRLRAIEFYRRQIQDTFAAKVADLEKKEVANANHATTAPPPFATRIHNSYEDFLNFFSFAINKVDESTDGRALTVRFNPLSDGQFLLGSSLTVSQPTVADSVKNAIGETDRAATVSKLESAMGNSDDLTFAVAGSLQSPDCTLAGGRCYGRSYLTYQKLLSPAILAAMPPANVRDSELNSQLTALLKTHNTTGTPSVDNVPLVTTKERDLARQIAAEEIGSVAVSKKFFADNHLDLLPTLTDNQPQASLSATYHSTGKYSGPADRGASLELQFGRQNLNTLKAACRTNSNVGKCFLQQLESYAANGMTTDKVVFTASWKHSDGYNLATLAPVSDVVLTPIALPRATEYKAKAQYGRQLAADVSAKAMRIDGAAEFIRTSSGSVRTLNRFVTSLTLSIPYGDNVTIPLTVSLANKPEFLGDVKNRIGAHVGLSYRLPNPFGTK